MGRQVAFSLLLSEMATTRQGGPQDRLDERIGLLATANVWNWTLAGFGGAHLGLFFFQNLDSHRSVAHQ